MAIKIFKQILVKLIWQMISFFVMSVHLKEKLMPVGELK